MAEKYSNQKVKRCAFPTTTNCIEWQGEDIPCLGICAGDTLTELETAIANKVCELVGLTDMTNVVIPCELEIAFGTRDKVILEYINYLLEIACAQKAAIELLPDTNNPIVTLNYCCCNEGQGCDNSVELSLSEHIQKVLNCLCELRSEFDAFKLSVENTYATIEQVEETNSRIDCLRTALVQFNTANSATVDGFQGVQLNEDGCH